MSERREAALLIADVLDALPVTDTVFHDLAFTSPMTKRLLDAIATRPAAARVLLVGPNVALAQSLLQTGRDITIWHVPGVALTEQLRPYVARTGSVDELFSAAPVPEDGGFGVVVLPFILDIATNEPAALLAVVRSLLAPTGVALVVAHRAGGLNTRLRVLGGRAPLPDPSIATPQHSWSWPTAPARRLVDDDGLRAGARRAGMRVLEHRNVIDNEGVVEVNAMPVGKWLSARLAHAVKRVAPSLRDTVMVTLQPITVGRAESSLGPNAPSVTVIIGGAESADPTAVLGDLESQTYPRELVDVHCVTDLDASSANAAAFGARGDVVAFTDVDCRLPAGWIESGVRSMGGYVTALAGGVLADQESAAPFLALPGRTRKTGGSGLSPAANSFYVRAAFTEVGGFDTDAGGAWGWDSTASARLEGAGYPVAADPTAFVFRNFPLPTNRGWIRDEFEFARGIPAGIKRQPELRSRTLHHRYFASERTFAFDLMVLGAGVALVRRNPLYAVAGALPWIRSVSEFVDGWPPAEWGTSVRHVRGAALRNVVWGAGLVDGSLRARRIVL